MTESSFRFTEIKRSRRQPESDRSRDRDPTRRACARRRGGFFLGVQRISKSVKVRHGEATQTCRPREVDRAHGTPAEGLAAEPGRVRLWPWQRAIADAISDPACERVTLLKPTRVGGAPRLGLAARAAWPLSASEAAGCVLRAAGGVG